MRILLATDGSKPAGRAVHLVANMGWPKGTAIRIVSSVSKGSDMVVSWTPETASLSELDRIEDTIVRTHAVALESAERDLALAHPDCMIERFLLRGRAASLIVEEARDFGADLIVVGHRGHGPIETMLLGSVSAEVVDHAPCPVLVARDDVLGTVVLADDGSPSAVIAAAVLEAFPLPIQTPITVLSITDTGFPFTAAAAPGLYDQAITSYVRSLGEARDETARIAQGAADRLHDAGYRTTSVTRDGDPAHEIVEFATRNNTGLLVLGTRGHTGLKRLLVGSVARNVLLHAPCSVLIVRERAVHLPIAAEREPDLAAAGGPTGAR
jgi:nucleotide-binding universal stress UspA family protein